MKTFKKYFWGFIALSLLAVPGCKDPIDQGVGGETDIRTIRITNAGMTGIETIEGTVTGKTIEFTIPIETNIEAIRFAAFMSLGASFEKETYNFLDGHELSDTTLTHTVKIINGINYAYYEVTLHLSEPIIVAPLVDELITTAGGRNIEAVVDHNTNVIYLGLADIDEAEIVQLVLRPARTKYEFTEAVGNRLHRSNPGSLKLDFLGKTTEYQISFEVAVTAGVDFLGAIVHDFSTATTMYPVFTGDMTRSADFDGEHVLIVYRNAPRVHRVTDLLAGNINNPIMLDVNPEIVSGGTHIMSAGRLSHGRVFITNLVTALGPDGEGETLTVYYYETPTSAPQIVLAYNLDPEIASGPRLGDNMSVNLNESGDGFVYFVSQDGMAILRFTVRNFTEFSDPFAFRTNVDFSFYAFINQVEPSRNLITSTTRRTIQMIDDDGNRLFEFDKMPREGITMPNMENAWGTDVRIINHNRARYMIMAAPRRFAFNAPPGLLIYDISRGFNLMAALGNYQESVHSENPPMPVYVYSMPDAPTAAANAANTNWAIVDGRLVVFVSVTNAGFTLIEFPNNE